MFESLSQLFQGGDKNVQIGYEDDTGVLVRALAVLTGQLYQY